MIHQHNTIKFYLIDNTIHLFALYTTSDNLKAINWQNMAFIVKHRKCALALTIAHFQKNSHSWPVLCRKLLVLYTA